MKKIIGLILVLVLMTSVLCGCNVSFGLGELDFNWVHISTHHYQGCVEIEKWYDNENGVEVKTRNFGHIFLSEGNYILIADNCPICNAKGGVDEWQNVKD